jgi:PTS system ascorbate-specific IIA component
MIGILLVSHGAFGEALIHCASHVLGKRPLYLRQLGVTIHDDPDAILPVAEDLIRFLDQGAGVLVLTDIYGATPSNIASRILKPGKVEGIAGVNLPMLIRALTYRDETLEALIAKALSGGQDGLTRMPHITITNKLGLHARASAKLTSTASWFKSGVFLSRNGRRVNAKSIMGVMMLAAGLGATVEIETDGEDEQAAMDTIEKLFADKFGEGS